MPELPEVEMTCRALRRDGLVGQRIVGVTINRLRKADEKLLHAAVPNTTIKEIGRRGKYILITLEVPKSDNHNHNRTRNRARDRNRTRGGVELVIHLRMSGRLRLSMQGTAHSGYERLLFTLADGRELQFYEPRRLGTVQIYVDGDAADTRNAADAVAESDGGAYANQRNNATDTNSAAEKAGAYNEADTRNRKYARAKRDEMLAQKCGIEPLSQEFTSQWLAERLRRRGGALKPLLLKQTFIAGIGNIYCNEALWYARLHPRRKGNTLTLAEIAALRQAIRVVLIKGIRHGGTRLGHGINDFQLPRHSGENTENLRVYGAAGTPCPRCDTAIVRIPVGGRGTFLCPKCQPN